jgi:hypothetical protein
MPTGLRRSSLLPLVALVLLATAASAAGGQRVFTIPTWIVAIPTGIALACLGGAAALARAKNTKLRPLALLPLLAAAPFGCFCAPTLYRDTVTVGPTRVEQRTGFWWSPTVKGFDYADVRAVRIRRKMAGAPQSPRMSNIWEVEGRDGRVVDIDPGDLWENNTDEIVPLLRGHGVAFE